MGAGEPFVRASIDVDVSAMRLELSRYLDQHALEFNDRVRRAMDALDFQFALTQAISRAISAEINRAVDEAFRGPEIRNQLVKLVQAAVPAILEKKLNGL